MLWIMFLLAFQPTYGVEISSHRSSGAFHENVKTSPQIDPATSVLSLSHYEASARSRKSPAINTELLPATTEASRSNASKVQVKTEHGYQYVSVTTYVSMIKDAVINRIKGIPTPDFRDLSRLSVCSVSGQLEPVLYDRRDLICCEGLHKRTSADDICCQRQVVSAAEVFCCSDTIHRRSETNHTACCGDRLYDPEEAICCRSNLYNRTESATCCGSELYDMRTQICCYDLSVYERKDGDQCCGLGVYHSSNQTCCFGNIQPAYGKNNSRGGCCDVKSYDARCFYCDTNSKIPVPTFDINKRICCDGKIRKRQWDITRCCGRRPMDARTQMCINNTIQTLTTTTTLLSVQLNHTSDSSPRQDRNLTIEHISPADSRGTPAAIIIVISICAGGIVMSISVAIVCYCRQSRKHKKYPSSISSSRPLINSAISELPSSTMYSAFISYQRQDENIVRSHNLPRTLSRMSVKSKVSKHSMAVSMPMEISMNCTDTLHDDEESDHPTMKLCFQNDLSKSIHCSGQNEYDNLVADSCTQTMIVKQCNLHNTFGRKFDHTYIVDARNPTVRMPESVETMTLPHAMLADHVVETHCSTYWDIGEMTQKFTISTDETIASPVVEYLITGYKVLPGYAVVVKPFIGRPDQLRVYKFESDHGAHPAGELREVPRREKQNEELDMFYVTEGNLVYIYTKSFSGFLCTTCKHSRNLILTAFLYGSYKRFPQVENDHKYEVRLKLYIADELLKFKDFQQGMDKQEAVAKRSLIAQQQLDLNDVMTVEDEVEMSIVPTNGTWTHKQHPTRNRPICNPVETIKLGEIAEQCQDCPNMHNEKTLPYSKEWYLVNREGRKPDPTFQCLVEIIFCTAESEDSENVVEKPNIIIVDDLALPEAHRHSLHNTDGDRFEDIKAFLTSLHRPKKEKLVEEISRRNNVSGGSVNELFDNMRYKLKYKGIIEEIVSALDNCQMNDEIKRLQDLGLVSYIPRPTQRVESHLEQGAHCKEFERMSLPDNNTERRDMNADTGGFLQGNRCASENNLCRREISRTLTSSVSGPPGYVHPVPTRPEIGHSSQFQDTGAGLHNIYERAPVQEHASMDETELMKVTKSNEKM